MNKIKRAKSITDKVTDFLCVSFIAIVLITGGHMVITVAAMALAGYAV